MNPPMDHLDDPSPSPSRAAANPAPEAVFADVLQQTAEDAGTVRDVLVTSLAAVAAAIRAGRDHEAMERLAEISELIEAFVLFLFHAHETVPAEHRPPILDLHDRILDAVEHMNGALRASDFVEMADCLEMDLVPTITTYGDIEATVLDDLRRAA